MMHGQLAMFASLKLNCQTVIASRARKGLPPLSVLGQMLVLIDKCVAAMQAGQDAPAEKGLKEIEHVVMDYNASRGRRYVRASSKTVV